VEIGLDGWACLYMKLSLGVCRCPECGFDTELPLLHPWVYGEFILWSPEGECRYLNALGDTAFAELGAILDQISKSKSKSADRADLVQGIFGAAACDRSQHGM